MSALPLIKNLVTFSEIFHLLSQFYGLELAVNTILLRLLDNSRSDIKIYAEIKLLFYYKVHLKNVKPRVLYANKSACYLCDLFIRTHGEFQILRTLKKFNKRWILPD